MDQSSLTLTVIALGFLGWAASTRIVRAAVPGAAITLSVLRFNLAGDALRDELDPRLRGR